MAPPNIQYHAHIACGRSSGYVCLGGRITTEETRFPSENDVHGAAGYMDLHFFMAYEPGISVAEMLMAAQNDYLNNIAAGAADDRLYIMTIEQFILLGDPSLRVGGYL